MSGHTIPRLELCTAVLAIEVSQIVIEHMDMLFDSVKYFTDSRVVLGYIHNDNCKRQFFVYVTNRVERIRSFSQPNQWKFVPTHLNPADEGARGVFPKDIANCVWLKGTAHLFRKNEENTAERFPLQEPNEDIELRPVCWKAECKPLLWTLRFERFSSWDNLVEDVALLKRLIIYRKRDRLKILSKSLDFFRNADNFIIKTVQQEVL